MRPTDCDSQRTPKLDVSRLHAGLKLLLHSYQCAKDVQRTPWDFAVEIGALRALGLTNTDFRWLCCKGHIDHSCEITLPGQDGRVFRSIGNLSFTDESCFILTELGIDYMNGVVSPKDMANPPQSESKADGSKAEGSKVEKATLPIWDGALQELRLGKLIIKQFKARAPNQEIILSVFQEEGWPCRIDDPLPPSADQHPKRRLHDTINALNRKQKHPLIRFNGDGTGLGIRWQLTASHQLQME